MVGLGSEGSFEEGRGFVEEHGVRSFRMLFDEPGESWRRLRVPGTPAALLLDRHGRELRRWFGPFDEREVLGLAARSSR